jgi:hypothetical protein
MKRKLFFPALGALMMAATANAQVDLYITGSTAFRANAYRSIRAIYGANLSNQNPADGGGNASGSNIVTWSGTIPALYGSQVVTVHASYSGSAAGVQALTQNTTQTYYSTATPGDGTTASHQADLAFSDVFQASTAFPAPALTDNQVGVQPFAYVKSATTPGTVTNITIQQLASFIGNGVMPLSYFTGNSSDDASLIYQLGRDSGSGTRITAEHDALFVGAPLLWAPDGTCTWNISSGFTSGSGISTVLNGTCGPAIGYLGIADAKNVAGGANILGYNGYKPFAGNIAAPDWTPVRKGLYSFWGYEHLFKRTTSSANVNAFNTRLVTEVNNDLATSTTAIQTSTMLVSRNADGGPISP